MSALRGVHTGGGRAGGQSQGQAQSVLSSRAAVMGACLSYLVLSHDILLLKQCLHNDAYLNPVTVTVSSLSMTSSCLVAQAAIILGKV